MKAKFCGTIVKVGDTLDVMVHLEGTNKEIYGEVKSIREDKKLRKTLVMVKDTTENKMYQIDTCKVQDILLHIGSGF